MEQGQNSMTASGKLRIVLFCALIFWCMYLALGYTFEFSGVLRHTNFIDTGEINDIYADGGDITWAVVLMGHTANAMIAFTMLILFIGVSLVTLFFSVIPTLLMTVIGLRKGCIVSTFEYTLTKRLHTAGVILSLMAGVIVTKFTALIPLILLTMLWALVLHIYMSKLKKKVEEGLG